MIVPIPSRRDCSKLLTIDNKCRGLGGGFQLSPALRSCFEYSAFDRLKNSSASSATLRLTGGR
jgi:hypothetical protein